MPGPSETQRKRRGHDFYPPADAAIPALYDTEHQPTADKIIHAHYFGAGCDWWIVELDPTSGEAFGYACLGDPTCAEWGSIYLLELEELRLHHGTLVIERDLHWTPRTVAAAQLPGRAGEI